MELKKPVISGLLAIALLFNLLIPSFAYNSTGSNTDRTEGSDEVQEEVTQYYDGLEGNDTANTEVYATRASTFIALIPKTIILDGIDGNAQYVVGAKGDVLDADSIIIEPNNNELTLYKKGDASKTTSASIEQTDTVITGADITEDVYSILSGSIQAQRLKAGSWSGQMSFVITLTQTNVPVHKHTLTHVEAIEATEEQPGNIEYWHCTDCGLYYRDAECIDEVTESQTIIPQLEHIHNLTYTAGVPATEEHAGNIEYWYCDKCGNYYSDAECLTEVSLEQINLPQLPHTHNIEHVTAVAATEESVGNIEYWHCIKCGKYYRDEACTDEIGLADTVLAKLPHTHNIVYVATKDPTATENGNIEYWYCSKCGKYYSDVNGVNEISANDVTVPNLNSCAPFEVTSDNSAKIGYKGTANEALVIPTVFKDTDGTWYKVTEIGTQAFWNCYNLTSVTIPNSVTTIGSYAFQGTGLTSVTVPNSVTSIKTQAFQDCWALKSVVIPNSVTFIENSVFSGCTGLTSITIPNSVTSIDENVFNSCTGLTSVIIPDSVTTIGYGAFAYCTGLTSVVIPNSVTSIGSNAFDGCSSLSSINIPSLVTSIGEQVFYNCTSLKSVTIPDSITSIGNGAFEDCSGLTSVVIPNSVTSIGNYAFSGCTGLIELKVPNSVTVVGRYAFLNVPKVIYNGTLDTSNWYANSIVPG